MTVGPELDGSAQCEPTSCRQLGATCGTPDDGCGQKLSCGSCMEPETCGGGGKDFTCGCTARTCEQESSERGAKVCGTMSDGCGGTVECGDECAGKDTCGGGPAANECGCTPNPGACAGKECGTADDGCGHAVQCGANAGACSANKECSAQQACACKTDLSAFCAGKCGPQQTPDGCSVACAPCQNICEAGETCGEACECPEGPEAGAGDDGVCRAGACCAPETVAALCAGAQCGTRVNRCGVSINCGTCGAGLTCDSTGQCQNPLAAALIGKYAVRAAGFGKASGLVSRSEALLLVDVFQQSGKLMMREQLCWSGAYSKRDATSEHTVTSLSTTVASNLPPTTIEVDLSGTSSAPSPKQWVRPVQPLDQNASGWRRGRPSYCPANGGPPDPSLPGFEPANDTRALGARKPWLGNALCKCPSEEFATSGRAPCRNLTGARLTACMADPATHSLPYSSGGQAEASSVTDCRVVDDDLDGQPGINATITATALGVTISGTVGSASVTANLWAGTVDTSGAKRHWAIQEDHIGLASANVTCSGSALLCATSTGQFCPPYSGEPHDQSRRVNPVDFVSLHDKTAPQGGWTCQAIYDHRNDAGWFTPVSWASRYPTASFCSVDGG